MENRVKVEIGKQRPAWQGWYRKDTVFVNGKELHGWVHVRRRHGRLETSTHYCDRFTGGYDLGWLAKQNGITI